jgi:histidinol dehydrogenase
MKTYQYKNLASDEISKLTERPKIDFKSIFSIVQPIIDRIESDGDKALKAYTKEFDGVDIDNPIFDPNKIKVELDEEVKQAIDTAFDNIFRFHRAQRTMKLDVETMPGVKCSRVTKAGGAQAVAALALGTESVPKVDKILGPGNQYVTAAKMILQNSDAQISIDMPAGPSEVLVIADKQANPAFVAADLLSQAEHGKDSQVVLVSTPDFVKSSFNSELESQLNELPRKEIAQQALDQSFIIEVDTIEQAISFSNEYAPEHLILNIENSEDYKDEIINAGSVFLGNLTPESVGDYASGTNHTLPTYGFAKM